MSFRIILRKAAELDVAEAVIWYEKRRSGLGRRFAEHVEQAIADLAERPTAWPLWHPKRPYRKCVLPAFPFVLFYLIEGDGVIVVAVAHSKRRPGFWLGRR